PGRAARGGTDGGSCDGGSDELRERRLSRRSSSAPRASSRRFDSTSSPIRNNSATAVSRSPSRIASASARSIPPDFGATPRDPARDLNAYRFCFGPATTSGQVGRSPPLRGLPAISGFRRRLHANSRAGSARDEKGRRSNTSVAGNKRWPIYRCFYGSDGTRTRDLRRDIRSWRL